MANISTWLQKIATAIYGKDMREAIHDSIEAVNNDLEDHKGSSSSEMSSMTSRLAQAEKDIDSNEKKITDLTSDMDEQFDGVNGNIDRIDTDISYIKLSLNNKVGKTDYASVTQAGIVKLYNSGGTNRSGLLVQSDGSLLVNVNSEYGLNRTGDGKLVISPATNDDIDKRTQNYKPIVPSTLEYAVNSVLDSTQNYVDLKNQNDSNTAMIMDLLNEIKKLHMAMGFTVYDGGYFTQAYDDVSLDGGLFTEAVSTIIDCGTFDTIHIQTNITTIDGGVY